MQILSIRCGETRNTGDFNSVKMEVEAAPSDGQSSDELLEEVRGYIQKALPEGGHTKKPAKKSAGKKSDSDPPLAGGKKGGKSTSKKGEKATKKTVAETAVDVLSDLKAEAEESPFDTDGETEPAEKAKPAEVTKDGARLVFKAVVDSQTLEQLLERFNEFRDPGQGFRAVLNKKDWQNAVNEVQDVYKKLTTSESDAGVMNDLVKAISSERNVAKQ